jgi:lipoic acid synthetase
MLGLGEEREELRSVFADLAAIDCNILTLGQYLRPSVSQLPVERYLPPDEFAALRQEALQFGFRHVESGPLVRSSYHAWQHVA